MEEYPSHITCHASAFNQQIAQLPDYDTVVMAARFPSGALTTTDLSRSALYGYDQRLEVFGSGGMLSANGIRPTSVVTDTPNGSTAVPIYYSFASRYADAYREELLHFLLVIRDEVKSTPAESREKVKISARDTLAACRISAAAEESAKSGGKTISLDWSAGWEDRMKCP